MGKPKLYETHTFMITTKIYKWTYCCAFNLSLALYKTHVLMKVIFIQRDFKNIQGLLGKIQGLFTDIPQISNFQGLFNHTLSYPTPTPIPKKENKFKPKVNVNHNTCNITNCLLI